MRINYHVQLLSIHLFQVVVGTKKVYPNVVSIPVSSGVSRTPEPEPEAQNTPVPEPEPEFRPIPDIYIYNVLG